MTLCLAVATQPRDRRHYLCKYIVSSPVVVVSVEKKQSFSQKRNNTELALGRLVKFLTFLKEPVFFHRLDDFYEKCVA